MIVLKIIAAIACFRMAWMAAGDAQTARERGNVQVFIIAALFAIAFGLSFAWVVLA